MGDCSSVVFCILLSIRGHIRWPSNQSLPNGPGMEDVEPVILITGGSPLPPEICGVPEEEKKLVAVLFFSFSSKADSEWEFEMEVVC